ncbi:MAG: hypothetical protein LBU60_05470 [Clostridiales bacterium]|jgi:hypothetical protein|nr:hypothetical protein [Clostridiales bacterium]
MSNSTVQNILAVAMIGTYFGGVGIATAIMTGAITTGMIAGKIAIISSLIMAIPGLQAAAIYILAYALAFAITMVSAVVQGRGVGIKTTFFNIIPTGFYVS